MKREQGYTLIEMMIAITLVAILSAGGLYGWQRWQQQQRLWQTAAQVRDYLVMLRNDANWHNRDRLPRREGEGSRWCLNAAEDATENCRLSAPWVLHPQWPEVSLNEITPSLGFYGLRNTAWPGHITLNNGTDSWTIVISNWGRIRLCRGVSNKECQ